MTTNLSLTLAIANDALTQAICERDSFKLENPEFNPVLTQDNFAGYIDNFAHWAKFQDMLSCELREQLNAITHQVTAKKEELEAKARILGNPVDYNIKYITEREPQLANLISQLNQLMDAEHPDLVTRAVYKHYEYMDYKTASKKYTSKLAEKATRITELQREVDYVQLVVDEETWRPKYEQYAANHDLETDYDNLFDVCNLHYLESFRNGRYGLPCCCDAPENMEACVFVPNEDIDSGRYMDHFWIPSAKTCNRDTKILGIRTNHGTHTYPIGLIANTEPWVNMTRPL
jgi:hypothetical protein